MRCVLLTSGCIRWKFGWGTALFQRALDIQACDGARRREFLEISVQLDHALGLQAFDLSPLNCEGEPPEQELHPELWRKAAELRRALINAAAPNG
ncbi:hypothetical protein XI06_22310 [Bradyrhizobium sp. CCBAU 11434]|nr:hypothetical protein [Bradyrhizobium sp. CCBAU 11434]